jgi:hypothetical protein
MYSPAEAGRYVHVRLKPDATHSYRSASIGSRREALNAGHIPKKMPTDAEKPRPIAKDHHGSEMGRPAKK